MNKYWFLHHLVIGGLLAGCLMALATACSEAATLPPTTSDPGKMTLVSPTPTYQEQHSTPIGLPEIVPAVVESVAPSVVSIAVRIESADFFGVREGSASGTGVIFDDQGYIITNNHVVENASEVQVTLSNDRSLEAKVVGTAPSTDLAVLKVEPNVDIQAVPFGDATKVRVGEFVIAIGNTLGMPGSHTVTLGVISALGRTLPMDGSTALFDLIQTDAIINPGNSGGPLINLNGEVIGINTAIFRGRGIDGTEVEGIGFAIPTDTAEPIARQLIEFGRDITPIFGIFVDDVNPTNSFELGLGVERGVLITGVSPNTGASRSGLEADDIMIAIDNEAVDSVRELRRILRTSYRAGQQVEVSVFRNGKFLDINVVLEERSA